MKKKPRYYFDEKDYLVEVNEENVKRKKDSNERR